MLALVEVNNQQIVELATPIAVIISILLQQRAASKAQAAAVVAAQKTDEIHTMVNNNLTAARAEVVALQKQVTDLSVHIAKITEKDGGA
jgi:signal transduction histidine kinase